MPDEARDDPVHEAALHDRVARAIADAMHEDVCRSIDAAADAAIALVREALADRDERP